MFVCTRMKVPRMEDVLFSLKISLVLFSLLLRTLFRTYSYFHPYKPPLQSRPDRLFDRTSSLSLLHFLVRDVHRSPPPRVRLPSLHVPSSGTKSLWYSIDSCRSIGYRPRLPRTPPHPLLCHSVLSPPSGPGSEFPSISHVKKKKKTYPTLLLHP